MIAEALAEGKRVLCPRVVRRPRGLESYAIRSLDDLAPGTRGLWEPDPARAERTDEAPDLIVVPGLAFDQNGGRIGYGAGFYDRLLAVTPGVRAALAYSLQLIEEIPVEPHDALVHWVVTERGAVDCRAARRSGSTEEAR